MRHRCRIEERDDPRSTVLPLRVRRGPQRSEYPWERLAARSALLIIKSRNQQLAGCRRSESTKELSLSLSLLISGQIDARSLVPFYCRGVFASVIGRSERGGEQQRRPDSDVWEQAARDEISGADRVGD
jgi:hypothetical protein